MNSRSTCLFKTLLPGGTPFPFWKWAWTHRRNQAPLAAKQSELRRLQTETDADLAAFTPALLAKAFRGEL